MPETGLMDKIKPSDVENSRMQPSNKTHAYVLKTDCKEVLKVAFLKTHKTGGTTVMNVIQRFGHVRNLVFALPRSTNYLGFGETVTPNAILPAPKGQSYDLLINHVVYNRHAFRQIMPKETVYVTIIRHPMEQFLSAIEYLKGKLGYLKKLPENNSASAFLRNASYYETKDHKWSFTNNRMSFDLGLDHTLYHDAAKVKQFIRDIDQDFKLVMITEYMDESLLLLKKYLCWSFRDILYIPRNVNIKKVRYNFTSEERKAHRTWAKADYELYDYFLFKFKKLVDMEGSRFTQELRVFKTMLLSVRKFCVSGQYRHRWLKINKTTWNEEFEVTGKDCEYMLLEEVPFLQRTRTQYIRKLRRYGTSPWIVHRFNPAKIRRPTIVRRPIMHQQPTVNRRKYSRSFNRARLRRPR
ncbi:galactose-3-O-sulfotransferase 3-like [Liolophura sinensis]|uniref:galactose-3-O-sulfotransferase 3-like n=1 Tax=Liolophura sinensis TaxID=3198878 RepID=UPI0031589322